MMFIIYEQYAINLKAITQTENLSTKTHIKYKIYFNDPSQTLTITTPINDPDKNMVDLVKRIEKYIEENLFE